MTSPIQSPNFVVNAAVILENADSVINMIRKHLKVGCKKTHALDIAAAAFVNDYQTLKGLADKDYYELSTNLGSYDNPVKVTKELGFLDSIDEAESNANKLLIDCTLPTEWKLLRNGSYVSTIYPSDSNSNYFTATIEATGRTKDSLIDNLQVAVDKISEGYCSGGDNADENRSYSLDVSGKEYELPLLSSGKSEYAIVDCNGWIIEHTDSRDAFNSFDSAGDTDSDINSWNGDLMLLAFVSDTDSNITDDGDDLDYDDDCVILDEHGKIYHQMSFEDIIDELKSEDPDDLPDSLSLYKVVNTKR